MDHHHHHHQNTGSGGTTTTATASRTEAERLLGISEKLLHSRDLSGSREFALLAQETEPLLEGSDQILAITDVLLASERRVINNRHLDWYSILQVHPRSDPDLIKKNYRRLALLLHPDKNKYPFADSAFKLVADAWTTLSDVNKKTSYDNQLGVFSKVTLQPHAQPHAPQQKQTPRRNAGGNKSASFWTACPYCYMLYEYSRVYEDCCIRCQNCERAFHATSIPSLPPLVPGKEAYYCCWGFFPLGFSIAKDKDINFDDNNTNVNDNGPPNVNNVSNNGVGVGAGASGNNENSGFPSWMPGMFGVGPQSGAAAGVDNTNRSGGGGGGGNVSGVFNFAQPTMPVTGQKKRGRPRKNPI